jgi:uncharacterized protein YjlB
MTPVASDQGRIELPGLLSGLLPAQGSIELQHDGVAKVHTWHRHDVDEQLVVIDGRIMLFWWDGNEVGRLECSAGTWIDLPAGTVHGSSAGERGAVYVIRPIGGAAATTTFLAVEDFPAPVPAFLGTEQR